MKNPAKRLLASLAMGLIAVAVSACCGRGVNAGATAKCKSTSYSSANCKNCCNAYGAPGYSFISKGSCTCR